MADIMRRIQAGCSRLTLSIALYLDILLLRCPTFPIRKSYLCYEEDHLLSVCIRRNRLAYHIPGCAGWYTSRDTPQVTVMELHLILMRVAPTDPVRQNCFFAFILYLCGRHEWNSKTCLNQSSRRPLLRCDH